MRRKDKKLNMLKANLLAEQRHLNKGSLTNENKVVLNEGIKDLIGKFAQKIADKLKDSPEAEQIEPEQIEQEIIEELPPEPTPQEVKKIANNYFQKYSRAAMIALNTPSDISDYGEDKANELINHGLRKFKGTEIYFLPTVKDVLKDIHIPYKFVHAYYGNSHNNPGFTLNFLIRDGENANNDKTESIFVDIITHKVYQHHNGKKHEYVTVGRLKDKKFLDKLFNTIDPEINDDSVIIDKGFRDRLQWAIKNSKKPEGERERVYENTLTSENKVVLNEGIKDLIGKFAQKIADKLKDSPEAEQIEPEQIEQEIIEELPPEPTPQEVKKIATELIQRYRRAADKMQKDRESRGVNLMDDALRMFKGKTLTLSGMDMTISNFKYYNNELNIIFDTNVISEQLLKKVKNDFEGNLKFSHSLYVDTYRKMGIKTNDYSIDKQSLKDALENPNNAKIFNKLHISKGNANNSSNFKDDELYQVIKLLTRGLHNESEEVRLNLNMDKKTANILTKIKNMVFPESDFKRQDYNGYTEDL
tara:strand:+ start:25444 stop:27036 length:1593 start_codon:yes stop_codon:yes gene_type:complete